MVAPLPGTKISSLPPCISLIGNEELPCVQGGTTKWTTPDQLEAFFGGGGTTTVRIITTSGVVTVSATDTAIILNKAAPSSTSFLLPTVASRNGLALHVSDFAGTGGDMVLTAQGGETIMGLGTLTIGSGGVAGTGGYATIYPNTDLSGWYL